MKQFTKRELEIINKAFGFMLDADATADPLSESASELLGSDEFNALNEKIAEAIADNK